MFRAHMHIIRRSKLHYTASGIIAPVREYMCSKHVETWNKLIVKQKFCTSSWLITEMHGQQKVKKINNYSVFVRIGMVTSHVFQSAGIFWFVEISAEKQYLCYRRTHIYFFVFLLAIRKNRIYKLLCWLHKVRYDTMYCYDVVVMSPQVPCKVLVSGSRKT